MAVGLMLPMGGRMVFAFACGGALHWFCDALTVTGAPLTWWSQHRSTLFGGRLRQGGKTERGIAWGVALTCAWLFYLQHHGDADRFTPYLMPWQAHYQNGLIDAAEWRLHRFSPF
jgi:inner membrane protein